MVMKKDRYTEKAWEAMGTSEAMVRTLRHNQLDVEHLVLAMLQQQDGPVPQIMELLGTDTARSSQQVPAGVDKNAYGRLSESDDLYHASFLNAAGPGGSGDGSD